MVQIPGISFSSKIRLLLSSGFNNEGFMISIRRKTDNALQLTSEQEGRERAGDSLIFALVLYSNMPSHECEQSMEFTTS